VYLTWQLADEPLPEREHWRWLKLPEPGTALPRSRKKVTVPVGVVGPLEAASVTVAVQVVAWPAATDAGLQLTAVLVEWRGGGGGGGGMPPQVVGEGKGVVKFFNPQKGFGFIVRDDGGEDVFVHISAVEQAGLTDLADGQPLEFTLVDRGGRVSATNLRIEGEPMAVERSGGGGGAGGGGGPQRQLTGEKASGTVKFFNAMKGFGFIQRDDGQPDAFVHISAVERAGMPTLSEGDRLEFELEVDRRGKYAAVNLQPKAD
jgi:cold shock CspA family protein